MDLFGLMFLEGLKYIKDRKHGTKQQEVCKICKKKKKKAATYLQHIIPQNRHYYTKRVELGNSAEMML